MVSQVVLIGSDCPSISEDVLAAAFAAVGHHDVSLPSPLCSITASHNESISRSHPIRYLMLSLKVTQLVTADCFWESARWRIFLSGRISTAS